MKINLYDIDRYINEVSNGKYSSYYDAQQLGIIEGPNGGCIVNFSADYVKFKSTDEEYLVETILNGKKPYRFPDSHMNPTIQDIIDKAPCTEIEASEYFHNRDTTDSYRETFEYMEKALAEAGINKILGN